MYETNVGAGLPLVDTIKLLHHSGENITRINGVFSGSLSYLFNHFSAQDKDFSEILQEAVDKGFTEPDPREDLSGNDVARKLLILARELDLENEFEDVRIQNLIPEPLRGGSAADFLRRLKDLNEEYQEIKTKQEKELKNTQRKKTVESDRFITLKQAAEEMESIVQRLLDEAAQRERAGNQRVSFFAELKGTLLAPYKGRIIDSWGDKVDPVTNLRSTSPGIKIKGVAGRKVSSVASGTIAYVGELRGYGNFIIINHDDRFFTTYAGLTSVIVTTDQYILAGEKLGVSDSDGVIKFEIRDNMKTVDPVEWIQIESFQ
jgi:murein DD-endopeptidase MepM/ murein hydrolase activator NlpD